MSLPVRVGDVTFLAPRGSWVTHIDDLDGQRAALILLPIEKCGPVALRLTADGQVSGISGEDVQKLFWRFFYPIIEKRAPALIAT
ncbi:hypothetical protein [Naasia aerilata]|uniref:Uncharacterized protein n=1 Tax=Naasia aerilata TaxID=1162966 RepID=A0ABM8GB79_9MICO|nr:hypothetical protein [Naasia aerilata]BDZ45485.1 hypothetical protein GCM10025866_13940 [Naasia aerilata]